MNLRPFGALYLILGTCIAAGMLGLPIVSANTHFLATMSMMFFAWLLSTMGAWCLLQANLRMPAGANFVTMAQASLGRAGKVSTWLAYLLLMLSILCAYLSASGDLLHALLQRLGFALPRALCTILAASVLGSLVYRGIRTVDVTNRLLMSSKLLICFAVMIAVVPYTHTNLLPAGAWHWRADTLLVMITAFGYAPILPSVREYLDSDRQQLQRIFWIGSFIPLILYALWIFIIQAAVPPASLVAMKHSADTNSMLMRALASLTHHPVIESISIAFVSICSVTGFLGAFLSLVDALKDGLHDCMPRGGFVLLGLLPPTVIVIFYPEIFIQALAYAGMCCVYLLIILPVMMYVVGGRKRL